MNSILAKQAPQMRPWLPMRVRQTAQTGSRSRSASGTRSELNESRRFPASAECSTPALSTSLIDMGAMIEPQQAKLEMVPTRAS
jgi:hypothetical protein